MKALVFLLILFNLLFYAFTQGYFGQAEHPDAGRIEKQVLAEGMRIVSRGEVPAVQAKAPEPEPAKPEIAPEPPQPEVVNKSATVEPACFAWASLSVAEADQLNALLEKKFTEFKFTRQIVAGEANGWWVFVPSLPGKAEVDKGRGVIRDPAVQEATLAAVRDFALQELRGAQLVGTIDSPIAGADGNREFLLWLHPADGSDMDPSVLTRTIEVVSSAPR